MIRRTYRLKIGQFGRLFGRFFDIVGIRKITVPKGSGVVVDEDKIDFCVCIDAPTGPLDTKHNFVWMWESLVIRLPRTEENAGS